MNFTFVTITNGALFRWVVVSVVVRCSFFSSSLSYSSLFEFCSIGAIGAIGAVGAGYSELCIRSVCALPNVVTETML